MNLLLIEPDELRSDGKFFLEGRRAEHLHCVLRAKAGDRIKTGLLNGKIGLAQLIASDRRSAELELIELNQTPPPKKNLIALIALPRPQSFKKTLHFIASSGIEKAYFIASERVEKSYWKSGAVTAQAIREELLLGLEQGVDTVMPQIELREKLHPFLGSGELDELCRDTRKLIAHPLHASECPRALRTPASILIGPEGGFIPKEISLFQDKGFEAVDLGVHILRVEFALAYLCGRLS